MAKKALVVSGGGSKGAYAVGVLKQLFEQQPDLRFDIFVGTSTGAVIVPLVASDKLPVLEQVYTSVRKEDIVEEGDMIERFRFNRSFYRTQGLANLIAQHINDDACQKIFDSGCQLFLATVNLQTAAAVIWCTNTPPPQTDYEMIRVQSPTELRRAALASSNQPVFMEPIEVIPERDNARKQQYVDGGVREYLGIQVAIDAGAEEIYAISLAPPQREPVTGEFTNIYPILERTLDIFSQDVGWNDVKGPRIYNTALRYVAAVQRNMRDAGIPPADIDRFFHVPLFPTFSGRKPLKIHHIFPESPLGGGPGGLNFDPAEMTAMLQRGFHQMNDYLAQLPQHPDGNV